MALIRSLALIPIFGLPLVGYLGALTLLSLLTTATVGYLFYTGKIKLHFLWHPILAITTISLAIIHGLMGLSLFLR